MIAASLRPKWARAILTGLAVAMLISALVWIRTLFGVALIGSLAFVLLAIRIKGDAWWQCLALQFIGMQACISTFLQVGYLFTERVPMSGQFVYSDTGQIAAALFLPYWVWAFALTVVTLWLVAASLRRVVRGVGR